MYKHYTVNCRLRYADMKVIIMEMFYKIILYTIIALLLDWNGTSSCPQMCLCPDDTTMQCTGIIPMDIPILTIAVSITNPPENIRNGMFAGENWNNITRLSLKTDSKKQGHTGLNIGKQSFLGLTSLRYLSITNFSFYVQHIHPFAFKGIEGLIGLNLEGNVWMDPRYVFLAINASLHNLEYINFARLGALGKTFNMDDTVLNPLRQTKVRKLDISGMNIGSVDTDKFPETFPYLQTLNMRRLNLNIITYLVALKNGSCLLPGSLQVLDISESESVLQVSKWILTNKHWFNFGKCVMVLKELIMNGITKDVTANGVNFYYNPSSDFLWEKVDLANNGIQNINFSFYTPVNSSTFSKLKFMNLSNNNISYIDPFLISNLRNLLHMNLTNNALGLMENMEGFAHLWINCSWLERISLANNRLSNLPSTLFIGNTNLRYINLSRNQLTSISFNCSPLKQLRFLDLHGNHIATIAMDSLSELQSVQLTQLRLSENKVALLVNIASNPFICTCDFEEFPQIASRYASLFGPFESRHATCDFEGEIVHIFEESSMERLGEKCQRQKIIVISSVSTVSLVIVGVITACIVYKIFKRLQRKRHLLDLIQAYNNVEKEHQFLVFLSYSSIDANFVDNWIYPQLQQRLQDILKVDESTDLICNGDLHFQAGKRIEEEIVKAVEASKVVVLFISKAFCSSPWCDYETMVSYYERKPIILMFKEDIPRRSMPSVLRKLFHQYVRAICKDVNGTMTLRPSWDKLCDSIIDHANI